MARDTRIVIVGGGYVGMYTALRLQRKLAANEASVTVIDPQANMTYQPFLPEAAAGSIEPRHVVVPLRKVLRKCHVLTGRVTGISRERREVTVEAAAGHVSQIGYDVLVVAPGSVARTLPIPGLAEQGIAFKNVAEAIYLRNHVLSHMDEAASTINPELRRKLLTFLVVGGGYAGVEALAELADMSRYASRYYENIDETDLRWVLVEASGRIMPEVSPPMGKYTVKQLLKARIEVYLDTRVKSMTGGHVVLDDGTEFDTDTIVWTAGVKPNPMLAETDLPLDDKGRVICSASLQVDGSPEIFSAGDCASVPDLTKDDPDAKTSPSAQHAVRQAAQLADNVIAHLRSKPVTPYKHKHVGSVASLGLYKGAAEVYGIKLKGPLAWFMHRTYHLSRMPTFNRKFRIVSDWTQALLFRREVVSLEQIHEPKKEFSRVIGPTPRLDPPVDKKQA
ncbi:NAD(P)/FAD-dependent oxidoreductase [Pseudonocardia spinosispora]|uniref:NAD(P)/FAD-dependent oxidoreductase n=1 Tax=Pseudonocardia spinosispora TaxID=103441 RepID=UPI00041BA899|nr:NAD(P)/FAD-dependent oxidoreductase [Pseudonocardia spinosispora]